MRGAMMEFPLTLPSVLERAGRIFHEVEVVWREPDKTVRRYTLGDFHRRARALAEALTRAGLRKGDRVATLMWNHAAHLEAYFGVPCAGGVLHTLNLRLHPDDIAYIAQHAEDRFVIVDEVLLPLLAKFRDRVNFERVFVVSPSGTRHEGTDDYEALLATATGDFVYPDLDEGDALGMCYTSGTTGKPKGVVYSHRSAMLHSMCVAMVDGLGLGHHDNVLPVVPQFHANAWGIPYAAVMVGAKLVMPGPHLDPVSLLGLMESEKVTLAAGVPTVWGAILEALDREPTRWKLAPGTRMIVGGSAAPEAMIRGFDRHGLRVVHAWGMTETSPLGSVSFLRRGEVDDDVDAQYVSRARQGTPSPFVEVRAVDDAGEVPWNGERPGELHVRGAWVAARYHGEAEGDDRWTADGWFRTGDVVTISARGSLKITDRTKDLIKSGGEWISSVDLENALVGHPAVREAAVVAVPHPKWTERPLAVVVLKPDATVTADELRAWLETRFVRFWVPDHVVFVDAIPKTSVGKIQKSVLRDRYKDHLEGDGEASA